jgi:predicted transcriptional regulator
MKTMAIRLEDELHAQLALVAQLEGTTVTDLIRSAVAGYIEQKRAELSGHAEAALAEIEREAATRRQAITALFGGGAASSTAPETAVEVGSQPTTRPSRSPRGSGGSA